MAVQIIKATKPPTSSTLRSTGNRLRVACYARVSTDSDEQDTSYEAQITHYTNLINSNPDWIFAGAYADDGISGTSIKHREQFNRMIKDCERGLIDLILTKSISRWGRNTVDNLNTVRQLRDMGVGVKFEKEGIYTLDNTGEMLITILSSFAQQESDSISKNVRLGIQFLMQQGKPHLNTENFLGFDKSPDDKHELVIVPEEAALVRRIYREYLEGYSPGMIAARLTAEQIKTPGGKDTWYQSTIVSILENEKYCGDLLMQKWYVEDFLNHKLVKNEGSLPQYFVEDHHEPIIPKEIFYQVQGEIQRRSLLKYDPNKIRFGSSNALRGRLICGKCGRVLKQYKSPSETTWRCRRRNYEKQSITKEVEAKCDCRIVKEKEAKKATIEAFNQLPEVRDELIRMRGIKDGEVKRLDEVIDKLQERKEAVQEKVEKIKEELESGVDNGLDISTDASVDISTDGLTDAHTNAELEFLTAELECLEMEYTRLVLERAETANTGVHIRLLLEFVDAMRHNHNTVLDTGGERSSEEYGVEKSSACYDADEFFRRTAYIIDENVISEGRIMSFSNDLVIRYLENVTVNDDDYEVHFKAGVIVTVGVE